MIRIFTPQRPLCIITLLADILFSGENQTLTMIALVVMISDVNQIYEDYEDEFEDEVHLLEADLQISESSLTLREMAKGFAFSLVQLL